MTRGEQMQADILSVLMAQDGVMSAYDIMDALKGSYPKIAPPTVYRALSALTKAGQVHRLESRNGYMACQHDHAEETAVLSICDDCGAVEETASNKILDDLAYDAKKSGFVPSRHVIEMIGTCGDCASAERDASS